MQTNILLLISVVIFTVSGAATSQSQPISQTNELEQLHKLMTGFFSSETQSLQDTSYLHIQLCMQPIWQHKDDGMWLYVEQALWSAPEKPYRQRVYQLYHANTPHTFISKVYELEEPLRWAGACRDENLRSTLTPEMLIDRPGCELYLTQNDDGSFSGATKQGGCQSSWRGAHWVSSHVYISTQGLISWDRGWSKEGELMWGPEEGGYHFEKLSQ
ncbi:MAG: chromophore lyase CpcT/CpeT [Bacteroidota bacterium]